MVGRRFLIFFDGTACTPATGTNVFEMYTLFDGVANFVAEYEPGPDVDSENGFWETIRARHLDTLVIRVYRRLCLQNIGIDDEIYICGYSRGAIMARRLAQMITEKDDDLRQRVFQNSRELIDANVKFLGLFEPVVGPLDFRRKARKKLRAAATNERIQAYVEALSADEVFAGFPSNSYLDDIKIKKRFSVKTATEATVGSVSEYEQDMDRRQIAVLNSRKSIWFPGSHSDCGGQHGNEYVSNHSFLTLLQELICTRESSLDLPRPKLESLLLRLNFEEGFRDSERNVELDSTSATEKLKRFLTWLAPRKRSIKNAENEFCHQILAEKLATEVFQGGGRTSKSTKELLRIAKIYDLKPYCRRYLPLRSLLKSDSEGV